MDLTIYEYLSYLKAAGLKLFQIGSAGTGPVAVHAQAWSLVLNQDP
jgi:hypothetical protein